MKLSLTQEQLDKLLEYAFIGYQVVAGNKDLREEDTDDDAELINHLYESAYEAESDLVIEHNGEYIPVEEFEEELLEEMKEYEEDITFENLTEWLALRDMTEEYSEEDIEGMEEEAYEELLADYAEAYTEELSESGVENLYLIDEEA